MKPLFYKVVLCLFFICWHNQCWAQSYPFWFLYPKKSGCREVYAGYANNSIFPDSAAARAIRNGFVTYAQLRDISVKGGQAFWNTEYGMLWMGSTFTENVDSTNISIASDRLNPVDTLFSKNLVAVALGTSGCNSINKSRIHLKNTKKPAWVESLPAIDTHIYAYGVAPEYYYETSSWWEAEKIARRRLASTFFSKIQSLQKSAYDSQTILNEEVSVRLRGIEVVERWRDLKEKIFYVLIRVPK